MCIYNTGSRTGLINSLREIRGELSPEETELRELTDSALTKLCALTDEDFAQLELPRSYAMIWVGFTMISPFLAFVCWYAKGKSRPAFMLSVLILAVLFNMTFVYGWGYFEARSVLELIVFIIGLTVLRRDTLKSSVLMGTISIVLDFYLIWSFHFILDKQHSLSN